ncbi:hypothetical protein BKA70DRAFT_1489382 [Coprinopsis sp. MPI-PUGE-AT-0042]|nr:hypothetical protein BKA70DRAFT_1489382 [Coprinopsis sp. MPI-PUGE-AT-0042]
MSEERSTSDEAMAKAMLASSYIYLVVMLMGVAIQLGLCLYSLWRFRRKAQRYSGKRGLFLYLSFAICILYSAMVLLVAQNMISALPALPPHSDWFSGLSMSLTLVYILIGDCLMLWRCHAIYKGQRWVTLFPAALMLTSFAFGILLAVQSATAGFSVPIEIIWIAFSVATNVAITSLVIAKLLAARRKVVKSEMYDQVPRLYQQVIIILVESAAPLALAGLCAIATSAMHLSGVRLRMSAAEFFLFNFTTHMFFLFFAALSPQLILFRALVFAPTAQQGTDENQSHDVQLSQSAQFSTVQHTTT